jgi:hypothetical protein
VKLHPSAAERVCNAVGRLVQVAVSLLLMILTALAWALVVPTPAYAADAQIDSFTINYDMQPSGVLKVKETIVWRFDRDSGRHGMQRDLVIREPDPDSDQDFVYGISNINVTSPHPGVATQFSSKTTQSQGGREEELNLRIGNPNQTISSPTATYVISYDVSGAMRSFNGYDEFYWDGPGFGNPLIKELQITTTVPGGAKDATCFAGPPESTTPCQTKKMTKDGQTSFAQSNVPSGQSVSVGVKITPGLQQASHGAERLQAFTLRKYGCARTGCGDTGDRSRFADRRSVVVAQERPRPALCGPSAGHHSTSWSAGTGCAE